MVPNLALKKSRLHISRFFLRFFFCLFRPQAGAEADEAGDNGVFGSAEGGGEFGEGGAGDVLPDKRRVVLFRPRPGGRFRHVKPQGLELHFHGVGSAAELLRHFFARYPVFRHPAELVGLVGRPGLIELGVAGLQGPVLFGGEKKTLHRQILSDDADERQGAASPVFR